MSEQSKQRAYENTVKRVIEHERLKGKEGSETQARKKAEQIMNRLERDNK